MKNQNHPKGAFIPVLKKAKRWD